MDRSRLRTDAVPSGRPLLFLLPRGLARAAAVLLVLAAAAPAEALRPGDPGWEEMVQAYIVDPEGRREEILALGSGGVDGLGSPVILLIADAHLRSGDFGEARRLLRTVIEQEEVADAGGEAASPNAVASMGHLGLALIEVEGGDFRGAYDEFALASGPESDVAAWAKLGNAQAAAAIGRTDEALETLQSLSADEGTFPLVREASLLSQASLRMQRGETDAAAALLAEAEKGEYRRLGPEVAYASSRLKMQSGDLEGARASLESLLATCPEEAADAENGDDAEPAAGEVETGSGTGAEAAKRAAAGARERRRSARRLGELEPSALLQRWVRNYREQPLNAWTASAKPAIGFDGCDLARATLASLEEMPLEAPAAADGTGAPAAASTGVAPAPSPAAEATAPSGASEAAPDAAAGDEAGSSLGWLGVLAAIVAGAALFLFLRRR